MDLQDEDKVVTPFELPTSRGQGGPASSGKQFKQKKREPEPHKTPEVEKPQKWNSPRSYAKAQWPLKAEGSLQESRQSLLTSCEAKPQCWPNVLTKDLGGTFAYKKVAAQSPRKWEPGLWKDRSLSRGRVWYPLPGTPECSSTQTLHAHGSVATPNSHKQKGTGLALLNLESDDEDSLSGSWENLGETKTRSVAQAPIRGARPAFLKPTSWDHKGFKDTWVRPGTKPGQSESLAVPYQVQRLRVLRHGAHVLSTAVNSFTRHVFTCGLGGLKVWRLGSQVDQDSFPESHLHWPIQTPGAYLCTCLLAPNGRMLFSGGHNLPGVSVWDLSAPSLYEPDQLPCGGLSCQALDANLRGSLAFAGFSNGTVRIWDLRDRNVVKDLPGRQGEANSVVIKDDTVWTGGLNGCLRCWDLRASRKTQKHLFKSQITSLSQSPWDDWLLVGLASGQHWLQPTLGGQACAAGHKDGAILGLKFSPYGQWWLSVGTDKLATIHSMPTGATEFQVPEKSCVTCCDVSANNRLIVTGARDCVSVYQVTY